jgi:uncharacterized membrane protein HdeD (DUF308 family)
MTAPAHIDETVEMPDPVMVRLVRSRLRDHWKRFVAEGAAMVLVGVASAVLPHIGTLAAVVLIGWLLFVMGLLGVVAAISSRQAPGYWSLLGLSLLTGLLGIVLALQPIAAELTLTVVLVAYFLAHAAGMVALAVMLRDGTRRWPYLGLSALVDVALAAIVIAGWPGTATWVIGLLVGINLAFAGLALIFAAIGAHAEA